MGASLLQALSWKLLMERVSNHGTALRRDQEMEETPFFSPRTMSFYLDVLISAVDIGRIGARLHPKN
jgi:hypothetical protein